MNKIAIVTSLASKLVYSVATSEAVRTEVVAVTALGVVETERIPLGADSTSGDVGGVKLRVLAVLNTSCK